MKEREAADEQEKERAKLLKQDTQTRLMRASEAFKGRVRHVLLLQERVRNLVPPQNRVVAI